MPVLLVVAALAAVAGAVAVVIVIAGSGASVPLPEEPTAMQRKLLPPATDPVDDADLRLSFEDTPVPEKGWWNVVWNAQEHSTEADAPFPWTVLAGLARTQSDFGRSSPYDGIDRNPRRADIYGSSRTSGGMTESAVSAGAYAGDVLVLGSGVAQGVASRLPSSVPNTVTGHTAPAQSVAETLPTVRSIARVPDVVFGIWGDAETVSSANNAGEPLTKIVKALGTGTQVHLVTYRDPSRPAVAQAMNTALRAVAKAHDNVRIVNWHEKSAPKAKKFFTTDGINAAGLDALTAMVSRTIQGAGANGAWVHPLKPGTYVYGNGFNAPGALWSNTGGHTGIDMSTRGKTGDPIFATTNGTVTFAGWCTTCGYGYYVRLRHADGVETLYAHMEKHLVEAGQSVTTGQQIGRVGSTGKSTGPHLHWEVRVGGKPVDPRPYLPSASGPQVSSTANEFPNTDTSCAVDPIIPPVGNGKNQGAGPFLITPGHAETMRRGGLDPNNPCDSANYVAETLGEVWTAVLDENDDYEDWAEKKKVARAMWTDVIGRSDLFVDPMTGKTDCAVDVTSSDDVAWAIDSIWACVGRKATSAETVTTAQLITDADGKSQPSFQTSPSVEVLDQLLAEARAVAFNFSAYDIDACDTSAARAGVFPLTASMASKYGVENRCDAAENIRAAARAFFAAESVPVKDRPTQQGRFAPAAGGWAALDWSMGRADRADFYRAGTPVSWTAPSGCATATEVWIQQQLDANQALLDQFAQGELTAAGRAQLRDAVPAAPALRKTCANPVDGEWFHHLALVAETLTAAAVPPADESDGAITADPARLGEAISAAPEAARARVLAEHFATLAGDEKVAAAKPGKHALVSRLAPQRRRVTPGPVGVRGAVQDYPIAEAAVAFAVGYGGILPEWETATEDVLTSAAVDEGVGAMSSGDIETVIAAATSQIGIPYSWGGGGPAGPSKGIDHGANTVGYDCSGLTEYAFAKVGKSIGGTTAYQQHAGKSVPGGLKNAQRGDLLLWTNGTRPYHVALYLGDGKIVEAPRTGLDVRITSVYDTAKITLVRRVLEPSAAVSYSFPSTAGGKALAAKLPASGKPFADLFVAAGRKHNIDPALLAAVAFKESSFSADVISCSRGSSAGAQGLMQFMPATASWLGVNACDPASAVPGAAKYLADQFRTFHDLTHALGAYNWGPGNVSKNRGNVSSWPKETRDYVTKVPQYCRQFGGCRG